MNLLKLTARCDLNVCAELLTISPGLDAASPSMRRPGIYSSKGNYTLKVGEVLEQILAVYSVTGTTQTVDAQLSLPISALEGRNIDGVLCLIQIVSRRGAPSR